MVPGHYCEWGVSRTQQCGKPARFTDPRPNSGKWLCPEHYDMACEIEQQVERLRRTKI